MKYSHNRELVEGLRALADFIESHPELPIEYPEQTFTTWVYDQKTSGQTAKDRMATAARAMGNASKIYSGEYFDLKKKFGPVSLEFTTTRANICKRVVTGTKLVPATLVPEKLTPARIEEEVEWVCDEPLLANN